ncbi:acetyl-CoA synthetase-like protein [Mycena galericulata]|nr:acetyl-CoA synthetase-like protein [Mycena galericulata]
MVLTEIPDNCSVPQFLFGQQPKTDRGPWIVDSISGEKSTEENLRCRTRLLAEAMVTKFNIGPDAVVCIISVNRVDYLISFWAAHLVGASVFVTNPGFCVEELVPQLRETRPTIIFTQSESFLTVRESVISTGLDRQRILLLDSPSEQIKALLPLETPATVEELVDFGARRSGLIPFTEFQLAPGEGKSKAAILFPSSGTTGSPKLILISHYAFIANILQAAAHDRAARRLGFGRYNPGEISCAALPFFHILGFLINVHHPLFSGMTVIIVPKFNVQTYIETIEKYRVTHLLIVPPMISLLLKSSRVSNLTSLRVVCIAGAPLNALVLKLANFVPQAAIGQIYGMTESGALTAPTPGALIPTSHTNSGVSTYSVGKLLPGVIARIVKGDGSLALPGETGELWVQSPSLALGYAEHRAQNETFGTDGWLQTGDEVYFDDNGELFMVQRIKEFMKVKGFRVNPAEIEGRLSQHPDIVECCVVAIPHEFCGQVPKAYVVLSSDARKRCLSTKQGEIQIREMLLQHASLNMISYKHLAGGIEFCDSIPQTPSGKHLRRLLLLKSN